MRKLVSILLLLFAGIVSAQQGGGGPPGGIPHAVQVKTAQNTFGGLALGTSGWVLTSHGAGADPSFQAAGGGSPGGSTTQIQFNLAGSFAGDPGFTYIGSTTQTLTLGDATTAPSIRTAANTNNSLTIQPGTVTTGSSTNGKLTITASSVGTATTVTTRPNIVITAGAVTTSGTAGQVTILGGAATSGGGGAVNLTGGSGTTSGGAITLLGGSLTEGNGSAIALTASDATTASSTNHNGGNILIGTGAKSASGSNGSIQFNIAGSTKLAIDGTGSFLDSTASAGSSGNVWTSQGAGVAPKWAPASAGSLTAYGKISVVLGTSCSISGAVSSSNLSSCTYNSTGNYTVFTSGVFSGVVPCVVTASSAVPTSIFAMVVDGVANQIHVVTYSAPSTLTDTNFQLFCTGT